MDAKNLKILLVDDEADFRQLMTFWLKTKGYNVVTAADGKAGLELIEKEKPNVVFLDLRMPIMDGVDVLKKIRKTDKELPIIIISAHINDPGARELTAHGIAGIFYKGENFEQALPLLETALRRHKRLKQD